MPLVKLMKPSAEAVKTLEKALASLRGGKSWTTGHWAIEIGDADVHDNDKAALQPSERNYSKKIVAVDPVDWKFCAMGAINHADGKGEERATEALWRAVAVISEDLDSAGLDPGGESRVTDGPITEYNDQYAGGYKDVAKAFRLAIKIAKGEKVKIPKGRED